MNRLHLATHNKGKLAEFQQLLANQWECLPGPKEWAVPDESGGTYQKNAEIKARSLFNLIRLPVLSDDSGLEIAALKGGPGVDSAIFGGVDLSWKERWDLLNVQMAAVHEAGRQAQFRCVLCYFDGTVPLFFEGICAGEILLEPRGKKGFGYDPIFFCSEAQKSFAEMDGELKNRLSHRGKATAEFLRHFAGKPA